MRLFDGMTVENGELNISGVGVSELKAQYGTPLYIYDENMLVNQCRTFINNFKSSKFNTEVLFASKAFSCLEVLRIASREGLGVDVVSLGEIHTAYKAGYNMKKAYFHGNNKTREELQYALEVGVGTIVIDNDYEYEMINEIVRESGNRVDVLLRINTGIDAHTHEYIKTAKDDSKFGYSVYDETIYELIADINNQSNLNFVGFHSHIGSQIFEKTSFFEAVKVVMEFTKKVQERLGLTISVLNLGGGFGVYYTEEDRPFELAEFLREYIEVVERESDNFGLDLTKVVIEPGRSLTCNAGSTLYSVGGVKNTFAGREYVFVDGGMADNPRYALYKAKYEAMLANKMNEEADTTYTVAGKCCESGDMLVMDAKLPKAEQGDLLLVSSTGAYNYSMSSNYNRLPKLPVVFVKDGTSRLVVKGETLEDLIRQDI
ncbi:diaminopimelate decarboxylase [Gemella haemolysans]|uniref:Diaminopimelate decarboxylase n=3 Tax=Gemella haemolysans TaxID=1379 RepID=A0AA87DT43_9BACL|nr:diaminopimelate decarboxylase [Gemella haemolysans]EGF88083.1 diaminopimelate decarboxylase [Gemella haemolysans M341]QIX89070.1 diaminopimelate decarboxylase [Gemella haemolysans]